MRKEIGMTENEIEQGKELLKDFNFNYHPATYGQKPFFDVMTRTVDDYPLISLLLTFHEIKNFVKKHTSEK